MTKVFINDRESDIDTVNHNLFSDILNTVYKMKPEETVIITEIELNGESLSEERERELYDLPAEDIKTLNIYTTDREKIISKTIKDLSLFLENLISISRRVSGLYRNAGKEESNKEFENFLTDMHLYNTAMENLLSAIRKDKENRCVYNKAAVDTLRDGLLDLTKKMLQTQEDKDWVMLADLMEYELVPNLEQWLEFLTALRSYSLG